MGLSRIASAAVTLAALAAAHGETSHAQSVGGDCAHFPDQRLTGIVRLADRTVVTWQSGAHNRCRIAIRIAATVGLVDATGTRRAERQVELEIPAGDTLALRGDFVLLAPADAIAVSGIAIHYVPR